MSPRNQRAVEYTERHRALVPARRPRDTGRAPNRSGAILVEQPRGGARPIPSHRQDFDVVDAGGTEATVRGREASAFQGYRLVDARRVDPSVDPPPSARAAGIP